MALEKDEAHRLAEALATLEKHYPINPLSEKHMALLAFGAVVVNVYGKRVPAILRGKPKKPPAGDQARAIDTPPGGPQGGAGAPLVVPQEVTEAAPWFSETPNGSGMN